MSSAAAPVLVGAGLAGLLTALHLAPVPCVVLTTGHLAELSSSDLAQGGIAAALGAGDSPLLHALDTLHAGAGLSEPAAVERITAAAPDAIAHLTTLGARFDRTPGGTYALGLEGAHSRRRVAHAGGDATGHELLRAAVAAARATHSVTILEHTRAVRVLTSGGRVYGVVVEHDGARRVLTTDRVVLATGGIGGLFAHTTNPTGSRGQGLALAARAGARLRDLEMVQFHPTALDVGLDPMPLVSEAVRGDGAHLVRADGSRLLGDDLAPRDIVARAIFAELHRGGRVFLDARDALGERFADHFPTVAAACRAAGIDPARDPIPVRPAAHYHMGGVAVDGGGRTSVPGLWAVGEVASTGLHGANRLASNSLLEAAVCARWVAEGLAATPAGSRDATPSAEDHIAILAAGEHIVTPTAGDRIATPVPGPRDLTPSASGPGEHRAARPAPRSAGDVRALMTHAVGVLRDGEHLPAAPPDATLVALLVATAALRREESRGAHTRTDFPAAAVPAHQDLTLSEVLAGAPALATATTMRNAS
ncbi:MAG: L-aspartate oxidase [Georgenia sp.]